MSASEPTLFFHWIATILPLIGLGSGQLPIATPPAEPVPAMINVAPEECLLFATKAGVAEPDASSANQTQLFLAEPEVRAIIAEADRLAKAFLEAKASDADTEQEEVAMRYLDQSLRVFWRRPVTLYVSSVGFSKDDDPIIHGGLLAHLGEDAADLHAAYERKISFAPEGAVERIPSNEGAVYRLRPDPSMPVFNVAFVGEYLAVTVGDGEMKRLRERIQTPPPAWLQAMTKRLPVERPSLLLYTNVGRLVDKVLEVSEGKPWQDELRIPLAALGLMNLESVQTVCGLDGEGMIERTLLEFDGPIEGMLGAFLAKPIAPGDVARLPSNVDLALAGNVNMPGLLRKIRETIASSGPRAVEDFDSEMENWGQAMGVDTFSDFLQVFDETWCVSLAPVEDATSPFDGLVLSIAVGDPEKLRTIHENILPMLNLEMEQNSRGGAITRETIDGQAVFAIEPGEERLPIPARPTYCFTDTHFLFALSPEGLAAALSAERDESNPVAKLVAKKRPQGLLYFDGRRIVDESYPRLEQLTSAAVVLPLMQQGLMPLRSPLPKKEAVLDHMRPIERTMTRVDDGIEFEARSSIPGLAPPLGLTPPLAAALLPAVSRARNAASRWDDGR